MRWVIFLFLLFVPSPGIAADCDCTIFPFKPDPPCFDTCTAKHLAIATAAELEKNARVDSHIARLIARIPESQRPPSLEGYRAFLSEKEFQDLKKALLRLSGKDFELIRQGADKRGKSIW